MTFRSLLGVAAVATAAEFNFTAVKDDIITAIKTAKLAILKQDSGSYGPLFIRLSWHCSGSYRIADGRGGCDGGRIRFDPEKSWPDNANLDKARELLQPVKDKHPDISWADLIALSGTTAIEHMGGPVLGFCGGRTDDANGAASLPLGKPGGTVEQANVAPCAVDGNCGSNGEINGQVLSGLIYVDPEGVRVNESNGTAWRLVLKTDPLLSVHDVRGTFARMGMNDSETVALTGGGHAFGKTHGNSAVGETFTSGFDGPWTRTPNQWGNTYFANINTNSWVPGFNILNTAQNHTQWTNPNVAGIVMLTADLALGVQGNDSSYMQLSEDFEKNPAKLDHAFKHAWYKLLTRDMGPHTRCKGDLVPPPQPFQIPLPPPATFEVDWGAIRSSVLDLINKDADVTQTLVQMVFGCASTYRAHDYHGGCNGAYLNRATLDPTHPWVKGKKVLSPIIVNLTHGNDRLNDIAVFASQVAIEKASGIAVKFCPGRSMMSEETYADATVMYQHLVPRKFDNEAIEQSELDARWVPMTVIELAKIRGIVKGNDYSGASEWTKFVNLDRFDVDCSQVSILTDGTAASTVTTTAASTIATPAASASTRLSLQIAVTAMPLVLAAFD